MPPTFSHAFLMWVVKNSSSAFDGLQWLHHTGPSVGAGCFQRPCNESRTLAAKQRSELTSTSTSKFSKGAFCVLRQPSCIMMSMSHTTRIRRSYSYRPFLQSPVRPLHHQKLAKLLTPTILAADFDPMPTEVTLLARLGNGLVRRKRDTCLLDSRIRAAYLASSFQFLGA